MLVNCTNNFAILTKILYNGVFILVPDMTRLLRSLGALIKNSLGIGVPLYRAGLQKTLTHTPKSDQTLTRIGWRWVKANNAQLNTLGAGNWDIQLPPSLKKDGRYLVICNHTSWADTAVCQYALADALPFLRFFIKESLVYLPVIGQAFYWLDFPRMKRRKGNARISHKTQNVTETRRALALLRQKPYALLCYVEGTRKTPQKLKESPYTHLLPPKLGALASSIELLGDQLDGILDVTLVYHKPVTYLGLWSQPNKISVYVKRVYMPDDLYAGLMQGKFINHKEALRGWLNGIWRQKDEILKARLADKAC